MSGICLVTGATGALGPSVVSAFHEKGYGVRAFARRLAPPGLFDPSINFLRGDILDEEALARALDGVDVVIHLAALLHIFDPPPSLRAEYERVNVLGTEKLIRACEGAAVKRIVYFSTIAVYGYTANRVLTETSSPEPEGWYGRTKLEAERIILAARDHGGQPIATILRLAAVYGSRVVGNYRRLVQALARRRFIPLGRGDNHRALIYDKDVARAAVLAAEHPAAAGEIFNVSDGATPTLSDIIGSICAALGRSAPRFSIPLAPVRCSVQIAHSIASAAGVKLPVSPATIEKYVENVIVDSRKVRERLGFVPLYDQRKGWHEAIVEMRTSGVLR